MGRQDESESNAHLEEWAALLETDIDVDGRPRGRSETDQVEHAADRR